MKPSEELARFVVENAIPGARMDFRAQQHIRTHDFDLHLPDGTVAALEVTSAVNPKQLSTEDAILDEKKGGPLIPRRIAKRDWAVQLRTGANVERVRKEVDTYLSRIEGDGLTEFYAEFGPRPPSVLGMSQDLGIEAGWATEFDPPGRIGLMASGMEDWLSIGPLFEAWRSAGNRIDNQEKLSTAATPQRHLFLYVDSTHLAWLSLREIRGGPLPVLPGCITHVWAAAAYGRHTAAVLATLPSGPWVRFAAELPAEDAGAARRITSA